MYRRLSEAAYLHWLFRQPADNTTQPYKFAYGRTALKYGLKCLGLDNAVGSAQFKILIPSFICEVVPQALEQLGIKPVFYEVTPNLTPVWSQVESLISNDVKGLMIVHYFGHAQDINFCEKFCKNHGILLIEDNAHGYGSKYNGQALGTFGDLGIVSVHKTYPLLNGAYLYLKNNFLNIPNLPLEPCNIFFKQFKKWVKQIVGFVPVLEKNIRKKYDYASQNEFREPMVPDYVMDSATHLFIQNQNLEFNSNIRRRIYYIWQKWAELQNLVSVWSNLAEEAVPMNYAAWVTSNEQRKKWFKWGYENGIDIHSWPTLPREVIQSNSNALKYWEKLICFPIHSGMNPEQLERKLNKLSFKE
ncbi:MAG: DegT/DnrJ/EryC1/StrS family aminotransferase [Candidatus Omnitrophica bacterium]|nr:DegT/DnrJ/EryC1/StrS family aminotransferase [Candidatus Omnitrophota bacterium]